MDVKQFTILILIVLLLAVGFGFLLGFPGLQVGANTTTQSVSNAGWRGEGNYPGGGGTTVTGGHELLNDDEYVLSWSTSLEGQRISVMGKGIAEHGFPAACIMDVGAWEYRLFYEPGHTQAAVLQSSASGWLATDTVLIEPRDFVPKGKVTEGILQAELWGHCAGGSFVPLAVDQAYLLSGIGSIDRSVDQAAIGETASFSWRVGYVTDDATGRGWSVDIYSQAQAKTVVGPVEIKDLSGKVSYTVTSADFSSSLGKRNELRATLRNELWDKSYDVTTTIDEPGKGPTLTITGFEPKEPAQGDTITVTWTVTPNADTKAAIDRIIVQTGFGGVEQEATLPATATSYSFVAGQQGTNRVIVIAYDAQNRPSPTDSVDIGVNEPNPPGFTDIWLLAFILILAVGVLIAIAVGKSNIYIVGGVIIVFVIIAYVGAGIIQGAV